MRIFSGVQPTGELHIGNYLGAIKQWVELQNKGNECIFCIVDLHAISSPFEPRSFHQLAMEKAIAYLASGIDPTKSIIFLQSKVKEHTELCWILNAVTPVGDLTRMTQYKDKSKKFAKNLNAGILNYPILMASDILLYKTDVVPVGEDQKQHVELTRTIAKKFNSKFGETFVLPEPKIAKSGAKIMSLTNPDKKMSKTDNPDSYIGLFDDPDIIKKKIAKATTDTEKEIKYDLKKKPGISNMLTIYSLLSDIPIQELEKKFEGKGYAEFKKSLTETTINALKPFREKREELLDNDGCIEELLIQGEEKARKIAQTTMKQVRQKLGLI